MVVAGSQRMGPMAMPGTMPGAPLGPELPAANSAMPPLLLRPNYKDTSTLVEAHCQHNVRFGARRAWQTPLSYRQQAQAT